jgi:hypothetical protein
MSRPVLGPINSPMHWVPVIKQPLTLHILSRLSMGGAVLLHLHMTLWNAQAQIYIIDSLFLLTAVSTVDPLCKFFRALNNLNFMWKNIIKW